MREAERHVSKHAADELTRALNPPTQRAVIDDKATCYRVAAAIGIPTPEPYGVLGAPGVGALRPGASWPTGRPP